MPKEPRVLVRSLQQVSNDTGFGVTTGNSVVLQRIKLDLFSSRGDVDTLQTTVDLKNTTTG